MAIFRSQNGYESYICGGSLISNDVIITGSINIKIIARIFFLLNFCLKLSAAHCIHNKQLSPSKVEEISIMLGAHKMSNTREEGRIVKKIKQIIIHEGWDSRIDRYTHDIALIRLNSPIQFSDYIRPINLTSNVNYDFYNGSVASWGYVHDDFNLADTAQIVDLEIVNIAKCLMVETALVYNHWEESFCGKSEYSGICVGDPGSGLYVKIKETYFLKGIVSTSLSGNCSDKNTALYSDVPKYYQFIKVSLKQLSQNLSCFIKIKKIYSLGKSP